MYRDRYISGTNVAYICTRTFQEAVNTRLGGHGRALAEALINRLGTEPNFLHLFHSLPVSCKKHDYEFSTANISVCFIKESVEDVIFITVK